MLTGEGAKLMDFGLAKLQMDNGNQGMSTVTRTTPLTGAKAKRPMNDRIYSRSGRCFMRCLPGNGPSRAHPTPP
jgi:hypothetical protein